MVDAVIEGAAGAEGRITVGGAGIAGRGGGAVTVGGGAAAGVTGAAGFSTTGATTSGRAAGGAGAVTAVAVASGADGATGGGVGLAAGGGTATGFAATAGAAGRAGAAAASFFCVIAFSTSPGREMCDRSILVLISSSPRSGRAERVDDDCVSDEPRMWARTFSASCSSSELEWVFFSVTPTIGRASRMALLLTSSSLARSLIRTLLIRPFLYSALCLGLHRNLTESASCIRTPSKMFARAITIQLFRERSRLSAHALRFRCCRLKRGFPGRLRPPLRLLRQLRRLPLP